MRRFWAVGLAMTIGAIALFVAGCGNDTKRAAPAKPTTTTTAPTTTTRPISPTPVGVVPAGDRYDIGTPALTDVFVDPANGDDANSGTTRQQPKRTIAAAWKTIPTGPLTTGYRIALLRGDYAENAQRFDWGARTGTQSAPIVVEAVDGPGSATIPNITGQGLTYFYVLGVNIRSQASPLSCTKCDHILLRRTTVDGAADRENTIGPRITARFMQSSNVFIEDSELGGATGDVVSFDAVQGGHIVTSRVHNASGWCVNLTGGTTAINLAANEFDDCQGGGVLAGGPSDLVTMSAPNLTYQTDAVRIVNNVLHDIDGPAVSITGSNQTVVAYNTAFRIGRTDHMLEVVLGERGCSGPVGQCQAQHAAGAWGTAGDPLRIIPSANVTFANNIFYNPNGYRSGKTHLYVDACREVDTAATNVPSPACADTGLTLKGNVLWNGPTTWPLGIGTTGVGCPATNASCNVAQFMKDNAVNAIEPRLASPTNGNFTPVLESPLLAYPAATVPAAAVTVNRAGEARQPPGHPGAY